MRTLYDHQAFTIQKYGGISRCFVELYKNMPIYVEPSISLCRSDNVYVKEIMSVPPKETKIDRFLNSHEFKGKWYIQMILNRHREHSKDWNIKHSINLLKQGDFDVFHPTFFNDYFLPYLDGKPFVLTIHDMTPELYPNYFGRENPQIMMKRKLAPLASAIIAVSENTKRDIIRILGIPKEKVHVVYHGCSFPSAEEQTPPFNFPYILYVGGRGWFKNFIPFVRESAPVLKKHKDLHVVCTGKPFINEELKLFEELDLSSRFIRKFAATDLELSTLYHHAECFVYPSEYEGFGIPILEAWKSNCPVLLSHTSCFPEIAKDAAVYFHDNDLAEKLEKILTMSVDEKAALLSKQRLRLADFSWKSSAAKLAQIYQSLI